MMRSTTRTAISPTTDGGVPDLSPREAVGRWINKLRASMAEQTVSTYAYQLKLFVEWCESKNIANIREVNGWDIESYETLRREHNKIITVNKELITLQNFLEYCERVEIVEEGIAEKVVPPQVPKMDRVDDTKLGFDRAQGLLDYYQQNEFGSKRHTVLAMEWFIGARLGAYRGLDVDDYDSDQQYVQFSHRPKEDTPLKNGQDGERAVALPDHLCSVMDAYFEHSRHNTYDEYGREPFFTTAQGRVAKTSFTAWTWRATFPCINGACPHGEDPDDCEYRSWSKASQCPSSRSPHQVRTGAITWMLNQGIPIEVISKNVNTSVRELKEHYDHEDQITEMEKRRRTYADLLDFEDSGGSNS